MTEHSGPATGERRFSITEYTEAPGTEAESSQLRRIRTTGRGSFAELSQAVERPSELLLRIEGAAGFGVGGSTENGVLFEMYDAAALREMGEVLIALSERADEVGLLKALRARPLRG